MKKAIVLAGGYDQIALIQELKHKNYYVLLLDYLENPPAKSFADVHFQVSTLDYDKVKEISVENNVDLVITACTDQALLIAAKVSEELNLPFYLKSDKAALVTNKKYMKSIMLENNIPTSRYAISSDANLIDKYSLEYPLVIKPVDCNSSKGVKKVYNPEMFTEYFAQALSLSRDKCVIIEDYIDGEEISSDFIIQNGKVIFLCSTNSNKIFEQNSFTIIQSVYPCVNFEQESQLVCIAQKIVDAFELPDGPLLLQTIWHNDAFYVVEFSERIGGGSKYDFIHQLTGFNIMEYYVNLNLGIDSDIQISKSHEYGLMNYVYAQNGVIEKISGLEELLRKKVINKYYIYKTVGSEISNHCTSSDRVFGYLILADSKEDANDRLRICDSELSVFNNSKMDIMMHSIHKGFK